MPYRETNKLLQIIIENLFFCNKCKLSDIWWCRSGLAQSDIRYSRAKNEKFISTNFYALYVKSNRKIFVIRKISPIIILNFTCRLISMIESKVTFFHQQQKNFRRDIFEIWNWSMDPTNLKSPTGTASFRLVVTVANNWLLSETSLPYQELFQDWKNYIRI